LITAQVLMNAQAIRVPFPKAAPCEVLAAENKHLRIALLAIGAAPTAR
jgi:hypothetical protein